MFYKVLDDVKVIEYGNLVTAPFCTKILADLGAEVIKLKNQNVAMTPEDKNLS